MRIRTIKNAYREIREQDPNTCITEWFLRQLITGGAIPSIRAGTKWLAEYVCIYFRDYNLSLLSSQCFSTV